MSEKKGKWQGRAASLEAAAWKKSTGCLPANERTVAKALNDNAFACKRMLEAKLLHRLLLRRQLSKTIVYAKTRCLHPARDASLLQRLARHGPMATDNLRLELATGEVQE